MKFGSRLLLTVFFGALLAACGQKEKDSNLSAIVAISLTQTASAPSAPAVPIAVPATAAPVANGVISGSVHLQAPPTPHMTVYAVDLASGKWASTETAPTDGVASFSLNVPPGSYLVYAFTDSNGAVGYSAEGSFDLTPLTVAAGQTVDGINVRPPGQTDCGSGFGVPASPDNRFKAVEGASASCKATVMASENQPAQLQRIQFAAGATSSQVEDILPAVGKQFVLSAMGGQEMTVNLNSSSGNPDPSLIIFAVRGADGTALASPDQKLTNWRGVLPTTQDYYIDLISVVQVPAFYSLNVAISAIPSNPQSPQSFAPAVPAGFESVAALSQHFMLPPQFPVSSGLPAVVPYIIWSENGDYDVSLDYGADCRGAGACHYGSLSGKKLYSVDLASTPNFVFDAGLAKGVTLAKGVLGYYLEGQCGASCDDSRVFWVVNGYQYMIGLKGAPESTVLDLANSAIANNIQ